MSTELLFNKKPFKISKDQWDLILKGDKTYEFRKLEEGITTGTYEFVSVKDKSDEYCMHCLGFETYLRGTDTLITDENHDTIIDCKSTPKETYGTATLKPIEVNPEITEGDEDKYGIDYTGLYFIEYWDEPIDKETYKFVKENFIDKGIDFIVYKISDVKESE